MLSPIEEQIRRKIEAAGIPLKEWDVNIYRGILTGFNDAFIIDEKTKDDLIKKSPKSAEIIRPILRGEDIKKFYSRSVRWLVNTHNGIHKKGLKPVNVKEDYNGIYNYLSEFQNQLAKRQDKGVHWTNLRNCAYLEEFAKPKIVWGNLNAKPNFTIDYEGKFIASPSVMLVPVNDSVEYLLSVLNSAVCHFYVSQFSYGRENGYIEYQKQFVEQLPIPQKHEHIQDELKRLTMEIVSMKAGELPTSELEEVVEKLVFDLYHFTIEERAYINHHYAVF